MSRPASAFIGTAVIAAMLCLAVIMTVGTRWLVQQPDAIAAMIVVAMPLLFVVFLLLMRAGR